MALKDYDRLYIGGDWVAPEGTQKIEVISPSTEEVVARRARRKRGRRRQGRGGRPPRFRPRAVAPHVAGRAWCALDEGSRRPSPPR